MSEESKPSEQPAEAKAQKPKRDASWSAPLEGETVEAFQQPDYSPLEPLAPALADAVDDVLRSDSQIPDLSEQFATLMQQPVVEGVVIPRAPIRISQETCPEGLMGFCITCSLLPCKYIIGRCLRHLLTVNEYGKD